jgi:hypothetical protein
VAERPTEVHHPSQKSLADVRGVRVELVRVYREAKANLIDPILFGRLVSALNTLQAMDNGLLLERRVDDLEASIKTQGKPNGSSRVERRL